MCGRWATPFTKEHIEDHYRISVSSFESSYNIAPGSSNLVIAQDPDKKAEQMKWGLIPAWASDPKIGYRMINARAETILEKPSYKRPFLTQRCLIPAGGFYEWRHADDKKIPYYIRLKNTPVFSFAGLYDRWKDPSGTVQKTFTIITTSPNTLMKPIHDRMPVIINKEYEDEWLQSDDVLRLSSLLRPYRDEANMEAYPVGTTVNSPSNNTRENIKPIPS